MAETPAAKKALAAKAAAPKEEPVEEQPPVEDPKEETMITVRVTEKGYIDRIYKPGETIQVLERQFSKEWMERVELDGELEE